MRGPPCSTGRRHPVRTAVHVLEGLGGVWGGRPTPKPGVPSGHAAAARPSPVRTAVCGRLAGERYIDGPGHEDGSGEWGAALCLCGLPVDLGLLMSNSKVTCCAPHPLAPHAQAMHKHLRVDGDRFGDFLVGVDGVGPIHGPSSDALHALYFLSPGASALEGTVTGTAAVSSHAPQTPLPPFTLPNPPTHS